MDLRSLRNEKGYTLKQVADGTGLPIASIGHWESGERQPAADVLPKLAEFYGITTDKLLGYKAPNLPAALEEPEEVFEERVKDKYGFTLGIKLLVPTDKVEKALFNEYDKVKKSFFKIGYYLTLIDRHDIYKKQGYATITDYAEDKLGLGSTSTYNFMQVYEKTKKFNAPNEMEERFLPFNQSQLVEFTRAKYAGVEYHVKPTDTIKNTKAYVTLWNKTEGNPKGKTVQEALSILAEEKAAREKAKELPQATVIQNDDVPAGQMSIFDEEESERPFDEPEGEPQEEKSDFVKMFKEAEDEFGGAEFVQGGGIDDGEGDNPIVYASDAEMPALPKKAAFRLAVKEFCEQYDYTIELNGRKQGAWAFGSVLFDYLQGKGIID